MALKIRLRRMGRKKAPHYRIVVAESSQPRDGRFVARVGHYNPTTEPMTLVVDRDKALAWIAKGATPTDTVESLFRKAGVYAPAPSVTEQASAAVTGVAKKAGKAVSGAAQAVAGAVASAASAVAGAVTDAASAVAERVTGGSDEAETAAPEAESTEATSSEAESTETASAESAEPTAEAAEPAADENQG